MGSPGLRALASRRPTCFAPTCSSPPTAPGSPRIGQRSSSGLGAASRSTIWIDAREGGQHSGNWGGVLFDPAIQLAHALACVVGSVRGEFGWRNGSRRHSGQHASGPCRLRGRERRGDAQDRPGLGQARTRQRRKRFSVASFTVLAIEGGRPEERRSTPLLPEPGLGANCAPSSGSTRRRSCRRLRRHLDRKAFRRSRSASRARRDVPGDAARFRSSLGPPGRRLRRPYTAKAARNPAQSRRRAAERRFCRDSRPADGLGSTFLSRLLQHAPNEHLPVAIARQGLAHHGGPLLRSRRAGLPRKGRSWMNRDETASLEACLARAALRNCGDRHCLR